MKIRKFFLPLCAVFLLSLIIAVSCGLAPENTILYSNANVSSTTEEASEPIVIGYSTWYGWWPWAIAEEEGLFEENGANVELKWYNDYEESMQALEAGKIDGNCQTLNDTISFAGTAVNGEVVVLVNDNSAGNDKIIVSEEIDSLEELKGKTVALEEKLVDDFLLSLALEKNGMSRSDVKIKDLKTAEAVDSFKAGEVDAVGVWSPFWLEALERKGSKELISSKEFPGAIPDLLVVSQKLIDERPDQVQAIVNTWFSILDFIEKNPKEAEEIMLTRSGIKDKNKFDKLKEGTKFFSIEENLEAFSPGNTMKHMPFAAQEMTKFMLDVELIKEAEAPDLDKIFNNKFVTAYGGSLSEFKDVSPSDQSFPALQNLVGNYNCIKGYPNKTFRGKKAATRYEVVQMISDCLDTFSSSSR